MSPALSVVMPVYNAAPFLSASIRSILDQTFPDFEFVILDDASTDGSAEMLHDWASRDHRIRLLRSPVSLGTVGSSNRVVAEACAPICARMDADDVSHPDRLRRQWDVLAADRGVVLVGSLWDGIDAHGRSVRPRDRWRLLRPLLSAPFAHGSIMFRREAFEAVGGYSEEWKFAASAALYGRLAGRGRLVVIPDALYRYRFHAASVMHRRQDVAMRSTDLMRRMLVGHADGCLSEGRPSGSPPDGPPSLAAIFSAGALAVWAGYRPTVHIPWRSVVTADRLGPALLKAIVHRWGTLSPSTLRRLLAVSVRLRDMIASRFLPRETVVEWKSPLSIAGRSFEARGDISRQ
jgi:hypothetical protein